MSDDRSCTPPPSSLPDEEATPSSVWLLIWTIYLAKLATIVLIIWAAHSYQATALIAATTWPWLVVAVALGLGPLLFQVRLRRVRARREGLQRAEWLLDTKAQVASGEWHVARDT
jgi:hypothetical protein